MKHRGALLVAVLAGCGGPTSMEDKSPIELGRAAFKSKDLETAITQFTLAILNARDYVFTAARLERGECYLELARIHAGEEEKEKRKEYLTKALDDFGVVLKQPALEYEERSRALVGKGHSLLAGGNTVAARDAFQEVLDLEPQATALQYHLEAHRELGKLTLGGDIDEVTASMAAPRSAERLELLRAAQHHYSAGLEVATDDHTCNLFKGICLHARGLDLDAKIYLLKACAISKAMQTDDPQAHYYLARATEAAARSRQRSALEHYGLAVEQDPGRKLKPLYARLVEVLLDYREILAPGQFQVLLGSLLSYAGGEKEYWSSVEELASRIEAEMPAEKPRVPLLVRALARARNGHVEGAVEDAVKLAKEPDFLETLARIFPLVEARPDYLYGRALGLREAGRTEELMDFFASLKLSPDDMGKEGYLPTLLLKGQTIVELYRGQSGDPTVLSAEKGTERDTALAEARALFQKYLDLHPAELLEASDPTSPLALQAREVRLHLAEALELMGSPPAAVKHYIRIATKEMTDDQAFQGILRLHEGGLLPEPDKSDAWKALKEYKGGSADILEYIQKTRKAFKEQALLYCQGCGRLGSQGDTICLECGRQIGPRDSQAIAPQEP